MTNKSALIAWPHGRLRPRRTDGLNPGGPGFLTSKLNRGVLAAYLAAGLMTAGCHHLWAQSDERRAANLEQAAVTAQNRGDYAAAATFWSQLLADFPQHTRRGEALHNSGLCHAKLGKYGEATRLLREALDVLDSSAVESRSRASLYLGFSHLELGKANLVTDAANARTHFQSAVDVLSRLLEQFPNYAAHHEALYFLGSAQEQLQQFDEAAAAYEKLVALPQATFYLDGLFALGFVYEQQQQLERAREMYSRFLHECGDHAAADEVRLRAGEVAWQLAKASEQRHDAAAQEAYLREATEHLMAVASQPEFALRDAAIFRLAWMAFQAGSWRKSSELFANVAEMSESVLASPAALLAGRALLQAQAWDEALPWLQRALDAQNELSIEAAHWRAQLDLRRGDPAGALALIEAWLPQAEDSTWRMELLMDRAEAARAIPERQADAISYYLDVAAADPTHRLAPVALYQAAFSLLECGEAERAIETCQRFQQAYAEHDYLPDVLEVWADAALTSNRFDEARQVFDRLAELNGHARQAHWSMRRGVAAFFQKRFDEAESILSEVVGRAGLEAAVAVEAHYWLGCAQLERQNPEAASASFERAVAIPYEWPRRVDALLLWVQALLAQGDYPAAERVARQMWEDHSQAAQTAEAVYRVASRADAEAAVPWLRALLERFPQAPLAAPSWFALGRRLNELGKKDEALAAFQRLLDQHPQFEGSLAAQLEMAAILRQTQRAGEARQILLGLAADLPRAHPHWVDAQYELALAEVAAGDPAAAIMRFELVLADERSRLNADRIHYEIAWAAREKLDRLRSEGADIAGDEVARLTALALEHFTAITRDFPESEVAADAWFQVAQHAYAEGDFAAARDAYRQSLAAAGETDSLRERSWYKLGWSLFRLGDYAEAQRAFEQQVQAFPHGALRADGLFMVSEALFAGKDYEQALQAYRAAKPVIDESPSIAQENRWFTALHAAQAANQTRQFEMALEFARQLADDPSAPDSMRLDAWLELGNAYLGLKRMPEAIEAWQRASADLGKTGARAACMIGDALFAEKKFEEAIQQFKLVLYGYGGLERNPEVDPWKAFAAYEAARCFHVQIADAPADLKPRLLQQSIEFFQYLVDHYPDSELAGEARTQLEKLRR